MYIMYIVYIYVYMYIRMYVCICLCRFPPKRGFQWGGERLCRGGGPFLWREGPFLGGGMYPSRGGTFLWGGELSREGGGPFLGGEGPFLRGDAPF